MKKKLLALLLAGILLLTACGFIVVDDDTESVLSGIVGATAYGEAEISHQEHSDAEIQQRLIDLGFLTGRADGIFGPGSLAALKAFQTFCGFEATGEKDEKTLDMLFGDPAALPTPSPTPLANGARDADDATVIKDIQERLIELNYLSGSPDGIFGPSTEAALRAFQELNGLDMTGIGDEQTLKALSDAHAAPMPTPEPTPRVKGAKGEDIKLVQQALQVMGFMGGTADGDFGPATEEGVKRYQQYVHDREVEFYEMNPTPGPTAEPTATPAPETTPEPVKVIELVGVMDEAVDVPLSADTEGGDDGENVDDVYAPDGIITDELMADILAYNNVTLYREDLARGSRGEEVQRLQRRLASLWYLSDSAADIDGQFGPKTENALKYFQKRNNVSETGSADKDVQLLLFSEGAVKSDRPTCMYKLKVSVSDQRVYAYKWVNGEYTELVRTMKCSTGTVSNPTPTGSYSAGGACGKWYYFTKFDCWAQYAYRISGPYLFHSVLYSEKDESTLRQGSVNALGSRASHGCVRLAVDDAKWIYNNCPAGTTVVIY